MSADATRIYDFCGLRVRSEIELYLPLSTSRRWDVAIRRGPEVHDTHKPPSGEVVAEYEQAGTTWYTATSAEAGYVLRFANCGEFVISADLTEMSVRADPSGRHELLPILMAGTAMAFLLTLSGRTVLHASAVDVNGATLALVGQSGRGKSTIAALMCAAGRELVADDVLVVDGGPPVTCVGGATELRLRAAAASLAEGWPDDATRTTADNRVAFRPNSAASETRPLTAVVIPAPSRTTAEVEIRRVTAADALVALLSFPRVHGWRRPDVLLRDFTTLSQVANRVPVYDVTIPWGPPFDPQVAAELSRLVAHEAAHMFD